MTISQFIQSICSEYQLPPPAVLDQDHYKLQINSKDDLYLQETDEGICLYSYLFPTLESTQSQMASYIDEINEFGKLTKNSVVSISKEHKMFVLSEYFDQENFQEELFLKKFKEFHDIVNHFKENWTQWEMEISKKKLRTKTNVIKP